MGAEDAAARAAGRNAGSPRRMKIFILPPVSQPLIGYCDLCESRSSGLMLMLKLSVEMCT